MSAGDLVSVWFSLSRPVDRGVYALSGLGQVLFKYAVDCAIVGLAAGELWSRLAYVHPSLATSSARTPALFAMHYLLMIALCLLPSSAPLGGGRTRLEGSTWYRDHLFPQAYWNLWSDALVHRIHRRVLEHVKRRSEAVPAHG